VTLSKSPALTSALTALLACSVASNSYGFAEVARGALTLETSARLTYDSYFIGALSQGDDDYYLSVGPTLRFSRRAGLGELSAFAGISVVRYDTYSNFDSEDFTAGFRADLPVASGSRLTGGMDLSYTESTVVDAEVMDRVPTKAMTASANLRYQLGLKTSLIDTVTYSKSDRSAYSDQTLFANDLSFSYTDFLGGTSLRLTHGYANSKSSGENFLGADLDQESNAFSASLSRPIVGPLTGEVTYGYRILDRAAQETTIGQTENSGAFFTATLSGPFLPPSRFPKTKSSASLSYQESLTPGINDTGEKTLTGSIMLDWEARERTSFNFNASRSVGLSANDLSVENTDVSLGVKQLIGLRTSVNGSVGYLWRSFRGVERNDETFQAGVTLEYGINRNWNAGLGYNYSRNKTDAAGLISTFPSYGFRMRPENYERHLASVSISNVF
jgi:hypothetical protein